MKKTMLKCIGVILLILQFSYFCYALEVETHEDINEYIARNNLNGFSLGIYLKNNLGIDEGITSSFNSREVWQLLRDGGRFEDKPPEWYTFNYLRSFNHFHNPIAADINKAGLTYTVKKTGVLASWYSAIIWSQLNPGMQSPYGYYFTETQICL